MYINIPMKHTLTLVRIVMLASFSLTSSMAFAAPVADAPSPAAVDSGTVLTDAVTGLDRAALAHLMNDEKTNGEGKSHKRVCNVGTDESAGCDARVVTNGKGTPVTTQSMPLGYGPLQFRGAYSVSGTAPTKKIIAIVDAYDNPNIAQDLATYSATFGIPNLPACSGLIKNSVTPCFQKVNQRGKTNGFPPVNTGWALEIALDVETAHAMCQNCSILLVEASSASYANLMDAVDTAVSLGANVVSNSYGSPEFASETTFDSHFNRPGVAFTVSAGDSGYGAQYPAASKYVTAVGGTTLRLNADNTYASETAWSGTGSGCSLYESKPVWQKDTGCAMRSIADVSAVADPSTGAAVYMSTPYNGQTGWYQVGGTSLAAPLIAATYALSGNIPAGTQENSLPYLPAAFGKLHDILSGTNGSCGGSYLCTAMSGYDGPTGLGSPNGAGAF